MLDYPVAPVVLAIVLGPIAEPITIIAIILIFLPLPKFIKDKLKKPE
ncbi:MAG: TctA family transporter [Paracoccaceae bacterium]|jgi:TctA family transporter